MSGSTDLYCTLTPDEQRNRRVRIQSEIINQISTVTEMKNGLQLEFPFSNKLYDQLEAFILHERSCCGFLRFIISKKKTNLSLLIDGPPEAAHMIARFRKIIDGEPL